MTSDNNNLEINIKTSYDSRGVDLLKKNVEESIALVEQLEGKLKNSLSVDFLEVSDKGIKNIEEILDSITTKLDNISFLSVDISGLSELREEAESLSDVIADLQIALRDLSADGFEYQVQNLSKHVDNLSDALKTLEGISKASLFRISENVDQVIGSIERISNIKLPSISLNRVFSEDANSSDISSQIGQIASSFEELSAAKLPELPPRKEASDFASAIKGITSSLEELALSTIGIPALPSSKEISKLSSNADKMAIAYKKLSGVKLPELPPSGEVSNLTSLFKEIDSLKLSKIDIPTLPPSREVAQLVSNTDKMAIAFDKLSAVKLPELPLSGEVSNLTSLFKEIDSLKLSKKIDIPDASRLADDANKVAIAFDKLSGISLTPLDKTSQLLLLLADKFSLPYFDEVFDTTEKIHKLINVSVEDLNEIFKTLGLSKDIIQDLGVDFVLKRLQQIGVKLNELNTQDGPQVKLPSEASSPRPQVGDIQGNLVVDSENVNQQLNSIRELTAKPFEVKLDVAENNKKQLAEVVDSLAQNKGISEPIDLNKFSDQLNVVSESYNSLENNTQRLVESNARLEDSFVATSNNASIALNDFNTLLNNFNQTAISSLVQLKEGAIIEIDTGNSAEALNSIITEFNSLSYAIIGTENPLGNLARNTINAISSIDSLGQVVSTLEGVFKTTFSSVMSIVYVLDLTTRSVKLLFDSLVFLVKFTRGNTFQDIISSIALFQLSVHRLKAALQDGIITFRELEKVTFVLDHALEILFGRKIEFNTRGAVNGIFHLKESLVTLGGVFDSTNNRSAVFAKALAQAGLGFRAFTSNVTIAEAVLLKTLQLTEKATQQLAATAQKIGETQLILVARNFNSFVKNSFEALRQPLLNLFSKDFLDIFSQYSRVVRSISYTVNKFISGTIGQLEELQGEVNKTASQLFALTRKNLFNQKVSIDADFSDFQRVVASELDKIKEAGLEIPGIQFSDSRELFQSVLPAFSAIKSEVSSVNEGVAQIGNLSIQSAKLASSLGISFEQVGSELSEIIQGNTDIDNQLASILGLNEKNLKTWKEQRKVVENVSRAISDFSQTSLTGVDSKSVEKIFAQFSDLRTSFLTEIGELLQEPTINLLSSIYEQTVKAQDFVLKGLSKTIERVINQTHDFYDAFSKPLIRIFKQLKELADIFFEGVEDSIAATLDIGPIGNTLNALLVQVAEGLTQIVVIFSKVAAFLKGSILGKFITELTVASTVLGILSSSFLFALGTFAKFTGTAALINAAISGIKMTLFINMIMGGNAAVKAKILSMFNYSKVLNLVQVNLARVTSFISAQIAALTSSKIATLALQKVTLLFNGSIFNSVRALAARIVATRTSTGANQSLIASLIAHLGVLKANTIATLTSAKANLLNQFTLGNIVKVIWSKVVALKALTVSLVKSALSVKSFAWAAKFATTQLFSMYAMVPVLSAALIILAGEITHIFKSIAGAVNKPTNDFTSAVDRIKSKISELEGQKFSFNVDIETSRLEEIKKSQSLITKFFEFLRNIFNKSLDFIAYPFEQGYEALTKLASGFKPLGQALSSVEGLLKKLPIIKFVADTRLSTHAQAQLNAEIEGFTNLLNAASKELNNLQGSGKIIAQLETSRKALANELYQAEATGDKSKAKALQHQIDNVNKQIKLRKDLISTVREEIESAQAKTELQKKDKENLLKSIRHLEEQLNKIEISPPELPPFKRLGSIYEQVVVQAEALNKLTQKTTGDQEAFNEATSEAINNLQQQTQLSLVSAKVAQEQLQSLLENQALTAEVQQKAQDALLGLLEKEEEERVNAYERARDKISALAKTGVISEAREAKRLREIEKKELSDRLTLLEEHYKQRKALQEQQASESLQQVDIELATEQNPGRQKELLERRAALESAFKQQELAAEKKFSEERNQLIEQQKQLAFDITKEQNEQRLKGFEESLGNLQAMYDSDSIKYQKYLAKKLEIQKQQIAFEKQLATQALETLRKDDIEGREKYLVQIEQMKFKELALEKEYTKELKEHKKEEAGQQYEKLGKSYEEKETTREKHYQDELNKLQSHYQKRLLTLTEYKEKVAELNRDYQEQELTALQEHREKLGGINTEDNTNLQENIASQIAEEEIEIADRKFDEIANLYEESVAQVARVERDRIAEIESAAHSEAISKKEAELQKAEATKARIQEELNAERKKRAALEQLGELESGGVKLTSAQEARRLEIVGQTTNKIAEQNIELARSKRTIEELKEEEEARGDAIDFSVDDGQILRLQKQVDQYELITQYAERMNELLEARNNLETTSLSATQTELEVYQDLIKGEHRRGKVSQKRAQVNLELILKEIEINRQNAQIEATKNELLLEQERIKSQIAIIEAQKDLASATDPLEQQRARLSLSLAQKQAELVDFKIETQPLLDQMNADARAREEQAKITQGLGDAIKTLPKGLQNSLNKQLQKTIVTNLGFYSQRQLEGQGVKNAQGFIKDTVQQFSAESRDRRRDILEEQKYFPRQDIRRNELSGFELPKELIQTRRPSQESQSQAAVAQVVQPILDLTRQRSKETISAQRQEVMQPRKSSLDSEVLRSSNLILRNLQKQLISSQSQELPQKKEINNNITVTIQASTAKDSKDMAKQIQSETKKTLSSVLRKAESLASSS